MEYLGHVVAFALVQTCSVWIGFLYISRTGNCRPRWARHDGSIPAGFGKLIPDGDSALVRAQSGST